MIPETLLAKFSNDTFEVHYKKGTLIFEEGDNALFYYQVKKGAVKMYNLTEDGKEFMQGFFEPGTSFGEPPLFGNFLYPASAAAIDDVTLLRVPKLSFMELLKAFPEIHLKFTGQLCKRLKYKSMIMKEVSVYPPQHRIYTLLSYLKSKESPETTYAVPLTRQQIADLTGLRVETVIRSIKKLEEQKKLKLNQRKILM